MQITYRTKYPAYKMTSQISIFARMRPFDWVSRSSGLFSKNFAMVILANYQDGGSLKLQPFDADTDIDGDFGHFPHGGIAHITGLEIK